ncbi:hypothetical protein [Thermosulfurimonas dismutans]|uniref:hypothetical protein n=1 Tax=Thermosulfurimonas dismutans TaxID=999894 RepID=UPI000839AC0D|nr:hypothetical protein [Thermosulfurimonas dismutans]
MKLILGLFLVLELGVVSSLAAQDPSSKKILQRLEELQKNSLEHTSRINELSSQVSILRQQNEEILSLLKSNDKLSPNRVLEVRLNQMSAQIEELRIQVQILAKAIMALIGVFVLILLFMIFRSRRSSRYGSIRI